MKMAGRRRRVGLGSVRARTALGAALVVSLAFAAGALILVTVLSRSLVASVDLSVRLRAEAISSLLRSGALPAVLPKSGQEETAFEQVVGPTGTVVASSPEVEGEGPILTAGAVANGRTRTVEHAPIEGDRSFRLLARTVSTPTGTFTIYTAGSLTDVDHSVAVVGDRPTGRVFPPVPPRSSSWHLPIPRRAPRASKTCCKLSRSSGIST